MSVLINGMKMPKDCPYCKMAYYNASDEFTGCAVVPDKRYAMRNDAVYAKSTQRPDWCPLVEVPEPHGDLIDRDALLDMVRDVNTDYFCEVLGVTVEDIDSAHTVIEAEGSEDE